MSESTSDWPPRQSAFLLPEGTRKYGSTGQLWEVRSGQWVRSIGRPVPHHGSGPDNA